MESANLHHHQHQLQGQLVTTSSLSAPSSYGAASSHAWTQDNTSKLIGSASNFNPTCNGVTLNPRQKNETLIPPLNGSMIPDLSFHWNDNRNSDVAEECFTNRSTHDLHQLSKIKQELSDSFPRFTDMLNSPSSIEDSSHLSPSPTAYIKDEQKDMTDLSEKLLLKTLSSGFPINSYHFSPSQIFSNCTNSSFGTSMPSRGSFSQIYPSINISNLNRSPSPSSSPSPSRSPSISGSSFDMNLQALDLLTSTRFNGSFGQSSHNNNLAMYNGVDRMQQQPSHIHSCNPNKVSSFTTNEMTEAKRPNNSLMEPKATQAAQKKSRLESRASCPPFKVRKEKLGDRIAALQQLVAPFGKTDTASVLMEAIGYIKFLQNQVETLSVPYMKSSRNKTSTRTAQTFQGSSPEEEDDEPKKDLRSRGLCLVPLSCMSYVTGDGNGGGGGGIWPPPNF